MGGLRNNRLLCRLAARTVISIVKKADRPRASKLMDQERTDISPTTPSGNTEPTFDEFLRRIRAFPQDRPAAFEQVRAAMEAGHCSAP
jgi:hypothetical protein